MLSLEPLPDGLDRDPARKQVLVRAQKLIIHLQI